MTLTLRVKNRATLSPKEKSYKMKQSSIFEYIYNEELGEYVTVPPLPSISSPTEKEFETPKKLKGGNTSKRAGESTEGEKKPAFERVWSKNDEVNLLEALVKYIQNKQGGPDSKSFDMTQFYATLDLLFHQKFTRDQVAGKVRKLKQKYKKNIGRKQKMNGDKDLSFSKLHDLKLFQLSKKVWVDEALDVQHTPSNNLYFDGLEEFLRENGLSLNILDEKDKMALEKKWNDFRFSEWVTFSKKAALIKEMMEQKLIAYGQACKKA